MNANTKPKIDEVSVAKEQTIKCVVWDLDDTVWQGVLLEDAQVVLKPEVVDAIKTLDSRGILQSIASKNDYHQAKKQLQAMGLWKYFLYPKISFSAKSGAIASIATELNIGLDTFAFVDDQVFELKEVVFQHPEIMVVDVSEIDKMLDHNRMKPQYITSETTERRLSYMSDQKRKQAEQEFVGPSEAFLSSLNMVFVLNETIQDDLDRTKELIQRTHQLNTTGYTYSFDQLKAFSESEKHLTLVARLTDDFGSYGTIGFALVEKGDEYWTIKLLLMSCRVMSRGVGTIMMHTISTQAHNAGVTLRAEFVSNNRNRQMYIAYKFGGFKEVQKTDDMLVLEHSLECIVPLPDFVEVILK